MDSQNPLKRSAQTGTPRSSFVLLIHLDRKIASSLARDHVKRELVCTLPIEATKAAVVIEAIKIVATLPDPVAWNHTSYIGTLMFCQHEVDVIDRGK